MFCEKCGVKIRDGAKFCHKCGASVSDMKDDQSIINQNHSKPSDHAQYYGTTRESYMFPPRPYFPPGTHPYHRLGGFLMFHVVAGYICGVSSFLSVISTIATYSAQMKYSDWLPDSFKGLLMLCMIGSVIISLITGGVSISYANQIRRKDPNVLHFIQAASLFLLSINVIYFIITFSWIHSILDRYNYQGFFNRGFTTVTIIMIIIIMLIGLLCTSIYFSHSVRVRTYMGSDEYLRKSIFNKNSVSPVPADGSDQPGVVSNETAASFNPEKQWYCTHCGRVNDNYNTSCMCGMSKPSGDLSKSWICKCCGHYNTKDRDKCSNCGNKKYQDHIYTDWICPKCGARNKCSSAACSVCYAQNPNKRDDKPQVFAGKNEWQCSKCGKVNSIYVGTCGCGQARPLYGGWI